MKVKGARQSSILPADAPDHDKDILGNDRTGCQEGSFYLARVHRAEDHLSGAGAANAASRFHTISLR